MKERFWTIDGTALNTIALCKHCKRAIQLRRHVGIYWTGAPYTDDQWKHFHEPPLDAWHAAEPCADVGAGIR
jgi:hypothetical protein